jgi:putative transcriptional regulator
VAATSGLPAVRSSAGSWHDGGVIPLKGKLLLATPPLADPNFDRTVVLMLEHGDEGALGLVLNRPTAEDIDELLPAWRPLVTGDPVLFDGGPVEHAAVIGLAWVRPDPYDLDDRSDEFDEEVVEEGLGTVDLSGDPFGLTDRVEQLRLFRGYAGWGPGQLEDELEANAWIVLDADRGDPFTGAPQSLWRDVLRRQGGPLARMGDRIPDDVSVN